MTFTPNGLTSASHQTFAGAFDLGMSQAGFNMLHKTELKGAFGTANCTANAGLIGDGQWTHESLSVPGHDISPLHAPDVDVVVGNPPCSGFSVMTVSHYRGVDSPVNACMRALMEYAAKCRPQVVVMESVQAAFSEGYPLMRILRDIFETETGWHGRVWINHVLHNAGMVGNTAERRRYFLVLTLDRPFIVHDSPRVIGARDRSVRDAIADLEGQSCAVESKRYETRAESPYARRARGEMTTVDGHFVKAKELLSGVAEMLELLGDHWPQGTHLAAALTSWYDATGDLPRQFQRNKEKMLKNRNPRYGFNMGFHQPTRWIYDKPSRVLTGGGSYHAVHPVLNRTLTFREIARVMGYPDEWTIAPNANVSLMPAWWGKQPCVECGKWVGDDVLRWFNETVEERLDPDYGTPFPRRYQYTGPAERELVFDHTQWPRDLDGPKFKGRVDETLFGEYVEAKQAVAAEAALAAAGALDDTALVAVGGE